MAIDNKSKNSDQQPDSYSVTSNSSLNRFPVDKLNNLKSTSIKSINPKNWKAVTFIIIAIILAFVSGFGGALIEKHSSKNDVTVGSLSKQKKIVTSESELISQIAKTVGPSVVSVNVDISSNSSNNVDIFGNNIPQSQQAEGTGIIISSSGLIVTNRHVVPEGTTNVSVTLSDGTELKDVSLVGRTNSNDSLDVAFLKIKNANGHKLTSAVVGDSSLVQIGDSVVAIGNALGQFQNTVTSGIISGHGRSIQAGDPSGTSSENLDNLFQTDAAINEGNSGGPLVNLNGQVIGINTATAGGAQNIGFAIPINSIKGLIDQVLKTGKFARPYIGVRYIPLTPDIASQFNLGVNNGAYLAPSNDPSSPTILPDSPADKAGLKEKDIIVAISGTNIDETHDLTSLIDKYKPGDKITLTINRSGSTKQIDVTLGSEPSI
ncbi:MAG TPA: trypsin-like peptidase domain-containing protein [Patescibacteria group bacterium]|nr:trypsin-like peptidase domain-containing protein [Patescibacteria group bacterium]